MDLTDTELYKEISYWNDGLTGQAADQDVDENPNNSLPDLEAGDVRDAIASHAWLLYDQVRGDDVAQATRLATAASVARENIVFL